MPDNQSAVPVSQRAREAAAAYIRHHDFPRSQDIRIGRCDNHAAVQAFAAFEFEGTAEVDALRAERDRLLEALQRALDRIEGEPWSNRGGALSRSRKINIAELRAMLDDATNRGEG